ncbi:hypothetical protein HB662_02310 [Roseomonas frigidaquae]|uniref:Sialate O-acetylesterase domain-containing protein n=1 Tax=Falsiroseomonas frigidaquae TaxID=487318 RepID=A0ABX1EU02_9PROT|nr:hypothetical protein [Falsiroseomonas frigidaquae]NKE43593.1 hypothetical protein [Falsiroseomonas frigidaquae]
MSGLIRVQDTRKVPEAAPSDEIALLGTRPDGSVRRTTRGEINAGAAAAGAAAAIPLAQQEGAAAGQTAAVLAAQPFANAAQIAAELAAMGAMARVGPAVGSLRNVVVDAGYRPIIVGDIHDGLGVRLRGEIVPLTDVAERVQVLEETAGAGSEAGSLATIAVGAQGLVGPAVGNIKTAVLDGALRVRSQVDTRAGISVRMKGTMTPLEEVARRAADGAQLRGPAVGDYLSVELDSGLRILSGKAKSSITRSRIEGGALADIGSETRSRIVSAANTSFGYYSLGANVAAIFPAYGQSYNQGQAQDYLTSPYYNLTPIAGAFMPAPGVRPGNTPFDTLVALRSTFNPEAPANNLETPAIEMGRTIAEGWAEAELPGIVVVLTAGRSGQPVQMHMRGTEEWEELMLGIRRTADAAIAAGLRPVVPALTLIGHESNRSGTWAATPLEWARILGEFQRAAQSDIQQITGQHEPVVLVTTAITRDALPCGPALGAALAARMNPGRIICAGSSHAAVHGTDAHPLVLGYRQIGRTAGRAILRAVLGYNWRPVECRRWWDVGPREMRIEVELPRGASLVRDVSGDIVSMVDMDGGHGWHAWDRDGQLTLTADVLATTPSHPAFNSPTIQILTDRDVHWSSYRAYYAVTSLGIGGGTGGSLSGPRGCFRATDEQSVSDMPTPHYSWLLPAEILR